MLIECLLVVAVPVGEVGPVLRPIASTHGKATLPNC